MTLCFGAIAAAFALVATAIQAFSSLKQLREVEPWAIEPSSRGRAERRVQGFTTPASLVAQA